MLGAPTAKSRNQEAANLFDRGFAMAGGSGSLESLPSAGSEAPDMRANICLRHNAAAIDAAEEEGVGDDPSQVAGLLRAAGPHSQPARGAVNARTHRTLEQKGPF